MSLSPLTLSLSLALSLSVYLAFYLFLVLADPVVHWNLTLRTSEAGIPALCKLPCCNARRYTGFAQTSLWRRKRVYRRHGMSTSLFSNAYWHQNARVIEIQTRQQLKNIVFSTKQRIVWSFAFEHLAANVRVRCSDFSKLLVYAVYSNRRPPSLFGEHCEILRWRTLRKTLKRWWGRLENGGWRQSPARTRPVTYETGGPGGPGDETGDKTAATAGDERDGGDRLDNVYGRRGVRIWWGRDGSAWRVAFSCGIWMPNLLDALGGLYNLPS